MTGLDAIIAGLFPDFCDKVIDAIPSHAAVIYLSPPPCFIEISDVCMAVDVVADGYLRVGEWRNDESDVEYGVWVGFRCEFKRMRVGSFGVYGLRTEWLATAKRERSIEMARKEILSNASDVQEEWDVPRRKQVQGRDMEVQDDDEMTLAGDRISPFEIRGDLVVLVNDLWWDALRHGVSITAGIRERIPARCLKQRRERCADDAAQRAARLGRK